jgi:hypothetical protein
MGESGRKPEDHGRLRRAELCALIRHVTEAVEALDRKDKLAFEEAMLRHNVQNEQLAFFDNDGTPHDKARVAADNAFHVMPEWALDPSLYDDLGAGIEYYGSIDKRVYEAVEERAGNRCERCGCIPGNAYGGPDAHHLHYATKGRERPEDLMLLCRKCHQAMHNALFAPEKLVRSPELAKQIRERENPVPFVVCGD